MQLTASEIGEHSLDQLTIMLTNAEGDIVLEVPCMHVGSANSHLDIAFNWLVASFVGESIAEFCERITFEEHRGKHSLSIRFVFRPQRIDQLAEKLLWLHPEFNKDLSWEDDSYEEVHFAIDEYAEGLEKQPLRFPELADRYLANHIAGYYDLDEEAVAAVYRAYPERRYGFWRSFASRLVSYDFYVSRWGWIVPHGANIESLLVKYGGFDNGPPLLMEAKYLSLSKLPSLVFSHKSAACYPDGRVQLARRCAEVIWRMSEEHEEIDESPPGDHNHNKSMFLSEEGGVLVVLDDLAQYVFFNEELPQLTHEAADQYLATATGAFEGLRALIGEPADISCPWNKLNDDQFEQLCYDVVRSQDRFDPATVRKVGKSRSRDGGRDLVVYTRERLGKPAAKWLVQCKLKKAGGSLGANQVQISDVMDQYGADGYWVITNGYIGSTLVDKMEGIKRRRNFETDDWSFMELERHLVRHPSIRERYFPRTRSVDSSQ